MKIQTPCKWVTSEDLGVVAFATKKQALAAFPQSRPVHCVFAFGFLGWLAMAPDSTENKGTILTPDGREIPCVSGWGPDGKLIGMRGANVRPCFAEVWREIMARVIEAGLNRWQNKS